MGAGRATTSVRGGERQRAWSPVPGGLTSREAFALVPGLAGLHVVGADTFRTAPDIIANPDAEVVVAIAGDSRDGFDVWGQLGPASRADAPQRRSARAAAWAWPGRWHTPCCRCSPWPPPSTSRSITIA